MSYKQQLRIVRRELSDLEDDSLLIADDRDTVSENDDLELQEDDAAFDEDTVRENDDPNEISSIEPQENMNMKSLKLILKQFGMIFYLWMGQGIHLSIYYLNFVWPSQSCIV